jgi:N-acetylglucosaminyl-diphospho-decaprenol L-rhamnosyltransferase
MPEPAILAEHSSRTPDAQPSRRSVNVSAVIPTYNSGGLLERCLAALEAADAVDDVIVMDGGSTDGSDERAAGRRGVRVVRNDGAPFARRLNEGVAQARNDLVLVLNDDAFLDPETPTRLAEIMLERPRVAVVGARLRWEDGRDQRSAGRYKTLGGSIIAALGLNRIAARIRRPAVRPEPGTGLWMTNWVPLSAGLVRKAAFEQVGGYDERFSFYAFDQDFARKLDNAGWEVVVRSDAGAVHIKGGSTKRKAPGYWFIEYHQNRFIYFQKWYPRAWRIYAVLWAARASLHLAVWQIRAVAYRLRSDAKREQAARDWVTAFRAVRRPARPGRTGES